MITYERSTLDERGKVYWARRSSSNDLRGGDGFQGQVNHGIHSGNQSVDHPGVLGGPPWSFVSNLRRRDVGGMVVRFAQAACGPLDRVQSAEERSAQTWQQE